MTAANLPDNLTDHLIGNRYRLVDVLGRGGTGVVYRAIDRLTGDTVALKQLGVSAADLQFAHRRADDDSRDETLALAFEFRTLAGLRHPNVVSVLDFGFDRKGQPFLTMQLIEAARPITDYAADLDVAEKVRLLCEMLQALAYLHRRDIIHRDIKPSNVLVSGSGGVKVMDFGFAVAHTHSITNAQGGVAGTLTYMGPEFFEGQSASVQSDLYAAGIIAYELFVGRYPYDDSSVTTLVMHILNMPPDTSSLPGPLAAVINRMTARNPEQRYGDAQAAIEALCLATDQPLPPESVSLRESYLKTSRFVGRESELETLKWGLDAILAGTPKGSAWLIGGESGVGKSRLVDELRIRAMTRGALVLRGQGERAGLPYQMWRDPIRRLALAAELPDTDAAILRLLVPDMAELVGRALPDIGTLDAEENQRRLIDSIVSSIAIASLFQRQPIVLILEDLQWAGESLEPMRPLIGMVHDLPLLIIGNFRDDEAPDLPARLPGINRMRLDRLSEQAIEELSHSLLGEAGVQRELLDLLKRETEGNAFFIIEAVRSLAEEAGRLADVGRHSLPHRIIAGGIKEVVQRRLARVPQWGQDWLKLAAVAGRQIDLNLFDDPSGRLEDWLTACASAAVLEFKDAHWRFSHDKLREALLAGLDAAERPALHQRVAEAIEHNYPDDPARSVVLLDHWRQAARPDREVYYAHRAVEQLLNVSSYREVVSIGSRVVSLTENPREQAQLLVALGEAFHKLGEVEVARAALDQSMVLARSVGDQAIEALCLINLGHMSLHNVDRATTRDFYQRSLDIAEAIGDQMMIARSLDCLGDVIALQGDYATAREYYLRSLALNTELGDKRGISGSLSGLGWVASGQSDYATSRAKYEESLALSREMGDRRMVAMTLGNLGAVASAQGDFTTARTYYQQQLQIGRETGHKVSVAWSLWASARLLYFQGDYESASEYNRQSLAIFRELGSAVRIAANLRVSGQIALARGEYAAAVEHLRESLSLAQQVGQQSGITQTLNYLGQTAKAQGEFAAAQEYFNQTLAIARNLDYKDDIVESLAGLGELAVIRGEYDQAQAYYEEGLSIARQMRYPDGTAVHLLAAGELHALRDELSSALPLFQECTDLARSAGLRLRLAQVEIQMGFARLTSFDLARAAQHFREGLHMADTLGAMPVVLEALIGLAEQALVQSDQHQAALLVRLVKGQPTLAAGVAARRLRPLLERLGDSLPDTGGAAPQPSQPSQPPPQSPEALRAIVRAILGW